MTLIKGNRAGLSSLGPNTTIYGDESQNEYGEIEEMHYLMVRVERMKKQMLGKVERIEAKKSPGIQDDILLDDLNRKEDMLYESEYIIEVGGKSTNARDEIGQSRVEMNFSAEMSVENQDSTANGSFNKGAANASAILNHSAIHGSDLGRDDLTNPRSNVVFIDDNL